jgi:hypothetical protein
MSRANEEVQGCVVAIAAIPVGVILQGFVLCKLWFWFVHPLGVPDISIPQSLGLSTLAGLFGLTNSRMPKKDSEVPPAVYIVFVTLIPPLCALLFGWVFYLMM